MTIPESQVYTFEKTANLRLLWKECRDPSLDWQEGVGEINQFLLSCPRLQKADRNLYLYFSAFPDSPAENDRLGTYYGVGRGVVGHMNLPPGIPFALRDFPSGVVFSFSLPQLKVRDLGPTKQHWARTLEKKGMKLHPTWRVRLSPEGTPPSYALKGEVQFFLKDHFPLEPFFEERKVTS